MNIKDSGTMKDGSRSAEISCDEVSFPVLIGCIKKIPGAVVSEVAHNPMTDDAKATIEYDGIEIDLRTPFSDFFFDCAAPGDGRAFDDFVTKMKNCELKWWQRF